MTYKEHRHIIIDHREKSSGIPELLTQDNRWNIEYASLKIGDYLINSQVCVERKTANDFVLSLIQNRMFSQCKKMAQSIYKKLILIEGNPYDSDHDIHDNAIRGALLSISVSWQIPVIYTKSKEETIALLLMASQQILRQTQPYIMYQRTPKRLDARQLHFLQGLPGVGRKTSQLLIEKFGTIKQVLQADLTELTSIKGIGRAKAEEICSFIFYKT